MTFFLLLRTLLAYPSQEFNKQEANITSPSRLGMKFFWSAVAAGAFVALAGSYGASGAHAPENTAVAGKPLPVIAFIEAPLVKAGDPEKRFPLGSSLVKMQPEVQTNPVRSLTPQFFAAADPQVSFDGTEIVFSAQRAQQSHWQIWEIAPDGTNVRQLTHCPGDCLQPALLPGNRIAYTSITGTGTQRRSAVYVCNADGTDAQPITFGPGNYQVETVLRSGRLLVSADWPLLARSEKPRERTLYTLRPDGSGLHVLRDNARANIIRADATELKDGAILFVERTRSQGTIAGGELAWIRPGALRATVITNGAPRYESARELFATTLIVAQSKPGSAARHFDLYLLNAAKKTRETLLYHNPRMSSLQPVVLLPHGMPSRYWSILHPQRKDGRILCLNSYLSTDAPGGRISQSISRVRVIALQQPGGREHVLGEAPVEKDGSFYASVPANTPVRFELIGAKGQILMSQRSWIWSRNGEDLGCAGCHEGNALAPENHWPLVLRRFDMPVPLGLPSEARLPAQP
jgi:Hydrazine synthase alpha subunit middle domain